MEKTSVEAINYDGEKWINQTQLGNALAHSNIASRTPYYSSEYKRKRYEIQDCEGIISSNNNDGHKNNKNS